MLQCWEKPFAFKACGLPRRITALKFCNAKPNIQWMFDGGSREAERTHSVESRAPPSGIIALMRDDPEGGLPQQNNPPGLFFICLKT